MRRLRFPTRRLNDLIGAANPYPHGTDLLPIVFEHTGPEWSSKRAAEKFIRDQGWSVGWSDVTGCRAVVFRPDALVAKWRNLTAYERADADAYLLGRARTGDLTLTQEQPS